MRTEREKRLRREMLAARTLRQKSRCLTQERASTRVLVRGPESVRAGRIVKGAVTGLDDNGVHYGFVIRVKPLTKSSRRALLHFAEKNGLNLAGCEFNLECPKGVAPAELGPDTLATAFIVTGNPDAWDAMKAHGLVTDYHYIGAASDRMKEGKNDPLGPVPVYRKPKAPKPKAKQRPGTGRMTVSGCEYKWVDEGHSRPKMVKRVVVSWSGLAK